MRPLLLCLAALALVRGVLYGVVSAPWQAPDEPGHFELVALIGTLGRVPTEADYQPALVRAINQSAQDQDFERYNPIDIDSLSRAEPPFLVGPRQATYQYPLYYEALAPLYRGLAGQPLLLVYFVLKLTSALLAAGTVLLAAATAALLFPEDRWLQAVLPLLVLFWPMQSFLAGALNNDNLATLAGTAGLYAVARLFRRGWSWPNLLLLAGCVALALSVKRTMQAFALLLLLAPILDLSARGLAGLEPDWRRRVVWGAAALLAVGVVGGLSPPGRPWLAQVLAWVPLSSVQWLAALLADTLPQPAAQAMPAFMQGYLWFLPRNLWAGFGWTWVWLPEWVYWLAGGAAVLAGLGLARLTGRLVVRPGALPRWQVLTLVFWAVLVAATLLSAGVGTYLAGLSGGKYFPGRYFMPLLVPLSGLVALGLRELVPARHRPLLAHGLLAGLLVTDAAGLALTLLPLYYQA